VVVPNLNLFLQRTS